MASYDSGFDEVKQKSKLDEELSQDFVGLFNTQAIEVSDEDERNFINKLVSQDESIKSKNIEGKHKLELLPEDTFIDTSSSSKSVQEEGRRGKRMKRSTKKSKNIYSWKNMFSSDEDDISEPNDKYDKDSGQESIKSEIQSSSNGSGKDPNKDIEKPYHDAMCYDFKLRNPFVDDDSD